MVVQVAKSNQLIQSPGAPVVLYDSLGLVQSEPLQKPIFQIYFTKQRMLRTNHVWIKNAELILVPLLISAF
jgi:hypothetical protein